MSGAPPSTPVVALAGGVGAARFLRGLVEVVDPAQVTAVVNTGDDRVVYGVHVSPDLDIVTAGSGTITVRSGVGGDQDTPITLPNLISASDIFISATGLVTVLSGARLIAGGDGTSLSVDGTGITLEDGTPGVATVSNPDTGTVSLTSSGAADVALGETAIAGGAGLLSVR